MYGAFNLSARSLKGRSEVLSVLNAAIAGAEPGQAVRRFLKRDGNYLLAGEKKYKLGGKRRIRVVGVGKASVGMLRAVMDILQDDIEDGAIITKHGHPGVERLGNVEVLEGSHPVTSQISLNATKRMVTKLEGLTENDLVICLISGGGSALMIDPRPGVSLEDMQTLNRLLLACGADIEEFNTLRKHLDRVKGGGLRKLAMPAQMISLIISDVVGSQLEVIASGPTAPDPSTFTDAWRVVEKYSLVDDLPVSIRETLQKGLAGELEETLKPGDPIFTRTYHLVIGDNRQAALAGIEEAHSLGFNTFLLTTSMKGEARLAGKDIARIIKSIRLNGDPIKTPACIIAGGETIVTLQGDGLGGRNQELALGVVSDLAGQKDVILVSLATDGEDGPTNAAGAVVTGETMQRAQEMGMNPEAYLIENNAYHFFERLDDLLRPGSTGTNVNDLVFGFVF
ncbi:MAG: glycerate kinase [Chloroflexi bacterium]|nr:glycerate kinase [Chloroflexota bacterium]